MKTVPVVSLTCLLLLCSAYLQGGFAYAFDFPLAIAEMRHFGLKPETLLTIVVALGASLPILAGHRHWIGVLVLAGFTRLANVVANRFREVTGAARFGMDRDGEVGLGGCTANDSTERRAAEEALRTAQAELARVARVTTVGQLTASIAHEVSQPLMSISSNAAASLRWLEHDPPELDQVRRGLQDIAAQSQRAGGIIQGLQALARKSTPVIEPVDLHATIRHIVSISRNELERHEVTLALALDADSGWVMGDAVQLQQVLLNIVINAIEAMSEVRGPARALTISSQSDGDGRIEIRADDSGVGFDAAMADRLFEAFYSTKDKGMGMGLAICRSIIEAGCGSVKAQPRLPHGCSILFTLPETPAPVLDSNG